MISLVWLFIFLKRVDWDKFRPEGEDCINCDSVMKCIPYRDVLSNTSFCYESLQNKLIYQYPKGAKWLDDAINFYLGFAETLLQSPSGILKQQKQITNYLQGKCGERAIKKINALFKTMNSSKKSLVGAFKCLRKNKWLFCHLFYRTCLQSRDQIIISKPCQEEKDYSVNNNGCQVLPSFFAVVYKAYLICPSVFGGNPFDMDVKKNTSVLEQCQIRDREILFSPYMRNNECLDKRRTYLGKTNKTLSGLDCQSWSLNGFLNNLTYPTLEKNYCRNPQGYGKQPWCFTNMTTRKWGYCNVSSCIEPEPRKEKGGKSSSVPLLWRWIIGIGILLMVFCSIAFITYCKNYEKKEKSTFVTSYLTTPLEDVCAGTEMNDIAEKK